MIETALSSVMSYGYSSPNQNTYTCSPQAQGKLHHADYRQSPSAGPWQPRPPPPTYDTSHYENNPSPPPPVLTPANHPSDSSVLIQGECMCSACNRPPQYHPPSLPHHSTAHYSQQPSWTSHQSNYNSPVPHSAAPHSEFQPNTASWSPGMAGVATYERNNNEPSMVSPNRYPQMPEPTNRYPSMQDSNRYMPASDSIRHTPSMDAVPSDPREWSALDVQRWIQWACVAFKLKIIPQERFQMNGKALCLMDLSMFMFRVPDGGERLYDDFQTRLKKALCHDQPSKVG